MELAIPLNDGDTLTTEMLQSWQKAIEELQRYAIFKVQPPLYQQSRTLLIGVDTSLGLGTPVSSSSSSSSGAGSGTGGTIDIQINWSFSTTIGSGFTVPGTSLVIPSNSIIPYQKAQDGKYYVLGQPRLVVSTIAWNSPNLQMKLKYDFGWFCSTDSDWLNIDTAVTCQCSSSAPSSSTSSSMSSSSSSSSTPATTITLTPCDTNGVAL